MGSGIYQLSVLNDFLWIYWRDYYHDVLQLLWLDWSLAVPHWRDQKHNTIISLSHMYILSWKGSSVGGTLYTRFFISNPFFNPNSVLLNFFMNWASNIAYRCCLIHTTIITKRHILYLVYLCPCLGLSMSYLCDLFFIFIAINHINLKTYLFFVHFSEYLVLFLDDNVDKESE